MTDNIPGLTTLDSWWHGFESPFKADVDHVVTRLFAGNRFGTAHPVMLRDEDFGVVWRVDSPTGLAVERSPRQRRSGSGSEWRGG
jgi:hypothetical protein